MTAHALKKHRRRVSPGAHKRARASIKGLILTWTDPDPLLESTDAIVAQASHRNPVRRLAAQQIYRDYSQWILAQQAFRWLVRVDVFFDYPKGPRQVETRELEAVTTVQTLNEYCMEQIEDAFRCGNMEHYTHTEFTVECLGDQ